MMENILTDGHCLLQWAKCCNALKFDGLNFDGLAGKFPIKICGIWYAYEII